jgi:hypothetical protein
MSKEREWKHLKEEEIKRIEKIRMASSQTNRKSKKERIEGKIDQCS